MKKSDFLEKIQSSQSLPWRDRVIGAAEEAGVKWDPEVPMDAAIVPDSQGLGFVLCGGHTRWTHDDAAKAKSVLLAVPLILNYTNEAGLDGPHGIERCRSRLRSIARLLDGVNP